MEDKKITVELHDPAHTEKVSETGVADALKSEDEANRKRSDERVSILAQLAINHRGEVVRKDEVDHVRSASGGGRVVD